MGFQVYFHTKETDDSLVVCVQVYEDFTEYEPVIHEVEKMRGATFYENELESFVTALDVIKGEGYDEVILYNQNSLLFKWLEKSKHENKLRNMYYKEIKQKMEEIVTENGTSIGYKVIKGKDNEAKKQIASYLKEKGTSEVNDLTGMFKREDKIVPFKRRVK